MYSKQLTGRKVYSNGSYAPTRGTVNPSGYIKREIRRRAKKRANALAPSKTIAQKALKHKLRNKK